MNVLVIHNSVEALKILYMVVAGLALATGLERLVLSGSGQFEIKWASQTLVFFLIFLTTVVRFVHGAMRHFDLSYSEQPHLVNWRINQPLWDFLGLGFEAFVFFILAYSLYDPLRFIQYYSFLLIVDILWLCIISLPNIKRIWTEHSKWWITADLIVLVPTGVTWTWFQTWLLPAFFITVAVHTIIDYPINWKFYFDRPFTWPWGKQSAQVEILFVAGAYMNSDPQEIERNIQLAEDHSIKLWNLGYKVFCPHLNTCHFETKSTASEKAYKDFDMRILQHCDAVFALPNWQDSIGAKAEIEEAKRLGKPVFLSLDELPSR
ncbi:MAG: DUF1937 family protein [Chloroflexi bacterium]|nr:DUF1937 family protein [Chloroflexota bacterium]